MQQFSLYMRLISSLIGTDWLRFMGMQGGIISNREELLEQGVQAGMRSLLLVNDNMSISDSARLIATSLGKVGHFSGDKSNYLLLQHPSWVLAMVWQLGLSL